MAVLGIGGEERRGCVHERRIGGAGSGRKFAGWEGSKDGWTDGMEEDVLISGRAGCRMETPYNPS